MIGNFVAGDEPVGDEGIIRIIKGREVGHFNGAAIWVPALCEELVDGVEGIGLNSVVRCEYYELGNL